MVKIIQLKLIRGKSGTKLILIVTSILIPILIGTLTYINIGSIPGITSKDVIALVFILIILLAIDMYLTYNYAKIWREYNLYEEFISKISFNEGNITIKDSNLKINYGELIIYKYSYGRRNYVNITFIEKSNINANEFPLKNFIEPQVFAGYKLSLKGSRPMKYIYYGPAIKVSLKKKSLFIIPLYPSTLKLERNSLTISWKSDIINASFKVDDETLNIYLSYRKMGSRKVILRIGYGYNLFNIEENIAIIKNAGSHEIKWKIPILDDIHVILIPESKTLILNTDLDLKLLPNISKTKNMHITLLGFRSAYMKLIVDIPLRKDIIKQVFLNTQPLIS